MRNFSALLQARFEAGFFVCVGLDPDYAKIPVHLKTGPATETLLNFCQEIVDSAHSVAAVYKLQSSFFEAYGSGGWTALGQLIQYIQKSAPEIPVILDAKRGDIGSTNAGYVQAIFEQLNADAITLHPYLGGQALEPFLSNPDKGIFILCHTSNPGAEELQELTVTLTKEQLQDLIDGPSGKYGAELSQTTLSLYQYVALRVANHWNQHQNCGLVVGATYPEQLREVRSLVGQMPLLIPGIGAQGGDVESTLKAGFAQPNGQLLLSSSRQIIFADSSPNFAHAANQAAQDLHQQISSYRTSS